MKGDGDLTDAEIREAAGRIRDYHEDDEAPLGWPTLFKLDQPGGVADYW